jgi:predicted DNA-binding transcriptional regulator YafY
MRTFRVSRIEGATPLNKPCKRPAQFNLAAYWTTTTKQLSETWKRLPATLRVKTEAAQGMFTWHSARQVGAPDARGWMTISVEFENEEEARFVVLGLGTRVEVLEPESLLSFLRKQVADLHKRLIDNAPTSDAIT